MRDFVTEFLATTSYVGQVLDWRALPQLGEEDDREETQLATLGGAGSGNFGHLGRPGEVGGSGESTTAAEVLAGTKISGAKGSNPGGTYLLPDGTKWYAKTYADPQQAYGEHAANTLYRELGIGAPLSTVGEVNGKTVYASKWVPEGKGTLQQVGLNKGNANLVLDGFAADAFMGNWDAVGTGLDNVVVHNDGSVTRIDNGGAFLHRAQGALKNDSLLPSVGEWQTLASPQTAPYYSKVFKAAGLKDANDLGSRAAHQIDKILTLEAKQGGWDKWVNHTIPTAPQAYRTKLAKTLTQRSNSLREIASSLQLKALGGEGSGNFGHAGVPGQVGGSAPGMSGGKWTKEGIAHVFSELEKGSSIGQIAKQQGLTYQQVQKLIYNTKQKQVAIAAKLSGKPIQQQVAKAIQEQKPVLPSSKDPENPLNIKSTGEGGFIDAENNIYDHKGNIEVPGTTTKYTWQEKTTGPQAGKYAYFQNGVQVSAAAPKADWMKAAGTINYGKGPNYVAPTPSLNPIPKSSGPEYKAEHFPGAAKDADATWPIPNDVVRSLGKTTPAVLEARSAIWQKSLTSEEENAIHSYTGAGSHSINSALWNGSSLGSKASKIMSAIDKAPSPPPPDLVWRGVSGSGVKAFVSKLSAGDVVSLKGFQSTSINPNSSWSGVKFEIKPTKGAYVRPISSHKSEYEFLLPHGAKYRVHGVAEIEFSGGGKHTVVQLEMTP